MNIAKEIDLNANDLGSTQKAIVDKNKAAVRKQKEVMLAAGVLIVPTLMTLVTLVSLVWRPFTFVDGLTFALFYLVTSLGVTMGYHRLLTHNSFKCTRGVKWFFTVAAAMSVQGPAIWWVAHHRKHHIYSDKGQDVHSPHFFVKVGAGPNSSEDQGQMSFAKGFWHAHVGWMLEGQPTSAKKYAGALMNDKGLVVIDRLYFLWVVLSLLLPAALAVAFWFVVSFVPLLTSPLGFVAALNQVLVTDPKVWISVALGGLLWGGFVRIFALHHATWAVNSVCHLFGKRPFATKDASRNNLIVALVTAGEGWHNGHHAFPWSARHGLLKGEFDLTWHMIRLFEKLGLVWAVRFPTESELQGLKQRT